MQGLGRTLLEQLAYDPLGAKGAGEGGVIPLGGVIPNAVASALGWLNIQLCELSLLPARIRQLIEAPRQLRKPPGA